MIHIDLETANNPLKLALAVADQIELERELYDQQQWGCHSYDDDGVLYWTDCSSPACVAGWTLRLATDAGVSIPRGRLFVNVDEAGTLLGLDCDEASMLFDGGADESRMPAILRHYGATGELDMNAEW